MDSFLKIEFRRAAASPSSILFLESLKNEWDFKEKVGSDKCKN
jgi:hypothetical protein